MSSFRSFKWDPYLIISQIVALQTFFYLTLGFWIVIIAYFLGQGLSLDLLFSYDNFQLSNWSVRLFSVVFFLNSFCSGFAIVFLVGRYKQCLDFSLTIHFYHFLACWIYNRQCPNVFSWYIIQLISLVIMTIFSEHISKKFELRTISVGPRADL